MDMAWNCSKDAILTFATVYDDTLHCMWWYYIAMIRLQIESRNKKTLSGVPNINISIIISSVSYSTSTTSIFSITSIFLFLMSLHCSFTYLENFWNLRSELFFCAHEVFKCWLFHQKKQLVPSNTRLWQWPIILVIFHREDIAK